LAFGNGKSYKLGINFKLLDRKLETVQKKKISYPVGNIRQNQNRNLVLCSSPVILIVEHASKSVGVITLISEPQPRMSDSADLGGT
jgi:hypothetical protein